MIIEIVAALFTQHFALYLASPIPMQRTLHHVPIPTHPEVRSVFLPATVF